MSETTGMNGPLEALLFVSDEPVSAGRLAKLLDAAPGDVEAASPRVAIRMASARSAIHRPAVSPADEITMRPTRVSGGPSQSACTR